MVGAIAGVVAVAALLAVFGCFVLWMMKNKKKKKKNRFPPKRMEEARRHSYAAAVVGTIASVTTAIHADSNCVESESSGDSDLETESETDIEIEDDVSISSVNMHTTSPLPGSTSVPGSVLA